MMKAKGFKLVEHMTDSTWRLFRKDSLKLRRIVFHMG
jgi:hypothetical protein